MYHFSMQPSQYTLRHHSPAEVTITVQRILDLRDLHLQRWENVSTDDEEEDEGILVDVRWRFFRRASRRTGVGADIARASGSATSLS